MPESNNSKLAFSRRRSLVKFYTQKRLEEQTKLGKVAGGKSGYFEISTIVNSMNDLLVKYFVDIEVVIEQENIIVKWIDCTDEKEYLYKVYIGDVKVPNKLPMMANEIQSKGAILSYFRRYGLVNALGLQATLDLIEQKSYDDWKSKQNTNQKSYSITEKQVKLVYGKMEEFNYSKEIVKKILNRDYKINEISGLTKNQMDDLLTKMKNNPISKEIEKDN